MVQLGSAEPAEDDLVPASSRSIASSNACRSFALVANGLPEFT